MKSSKFLISALLALSVLLGLTAKSALAMTIEPPDFNLIVNPGDMIKDVLHISNENSYPITLEPTTLNFMAEPGDETSGVPSFYPADEVKNGHELAPWIKLDLEGPITIPAKKRINITFTIAVPENAQPGGHFGAIHVGTLHEGQLFEGANVGILAQTSALIFVRVNGDARDSLSIENFFTKQAVYSRLPADFVMRLSNSGTTHVIPVGNIFITDMLGRQVASLEINSEDKRRVLPSSVRRFDATWLRKRLPKSASEFTQEWRNFAFGHYTATLVLNYGDPGAQKLISSATDFWVFPWMALGSVLFVIILIVLVILFLTKRFERSVIRRYETTKRSRP